MLVNTCYEFFKIHPTINRPEVTIISDQDKGSIAAIQAVLPQVHHFHCSWHRRANITKAFGNKDGTVEMSANWMFNVLANCKTDREIKMKTDTYMHMMHPREREYLLKVPDNAQYPASRCAMGQNIYMYGRSASSGVESMNKANTQARKATAVDALNAAMTLLRMESQRFETYKKMAWKTELPLTPKGMAEMEEVYAGIVPTQYVRDVQDMGTHYHCTVCRNSGDGVLYTLTFPKQAVGGSFFGTCNCEVPKRDGVPCVHMAVLADAGDIPNPAFTRLSVMPFWLTTSHWRKQYPMELTCNGSVNIRLVMSKYNQEDDIKYCPEWVSANKVGRPKKNIERAPGVIDRIVVSAKKRKRKMFCTICNKFNHNTIDCYQNPMNLRAQNDAPELDMPNNDNNDNAGEGATGLV